MNWKEKKNIPFKVLAAYFPEIELPIVLTSETASEFSKFNEPFSAQIIEEYCSEWEDEIDDFTEFVPCFKIPETGDFTALVYYKATLLNYGFFIVSYTNNGDFISQKALNTISINSQKIKDSAAIIEEDWVIKVVSGEQDINEIDYNTNNTKTTSLEILPTGDIIHTLDE